MEKNREKTKAGTTAGEGGPLFLIGLGLCDEEDISYRSVELLRGCAFVFSENYTNLMREGTLERMEKRIGRKIQKLQREEVENEKIILDACASGPTALLIPGDPMTATTHVSLVQAARQRRVPAHILHAASIFTAAAGAAGLQIYKFGKTATITYWRKNFEPTSFLDLISENLSRGAHTLCLLDIDVKMGPMKPSVALETMEKAQKKDGKKVVDDNASLFVLWHVGWPDEKIWAGKIGEYPFKSGNAKEPAAGKGKSAEEPPGPAVIILPGKMHFSEEEAWQAAAKK